MPGIQRNNFIDAFETGFGNTLGSIGVVIVLGSIIAEALKHTGAIQVITRSMVKLIGSNRMPLALTMTGFIIGVAIFSDVAYVILNPLVHSAAKTMGVGIAVMSTGLVGALQLTHAIVPPTPGPLAAAALLGADIGKTIIFGSIACLFGSMSCWAWGVYVAGPRIKTQASDDFDGRNFDNAEEDLPSTLSSYTPIIIPIVLIGTQSVVSLLFDEGHILRIIFSYLGWPVIALSIGVWLAYRNIKSEDAKDKAKDEWVEAALRTSAMILVCDRPRRIAQRHLTRHACSRLHRHVVHRIWPANDHAAFSNRYHWKYDHGFHHRWCHHGGVTGGTDVGRSWFITGSGNAGRCQWLGHHQVREQQLLLGLYFAHQVERYRCGIQLRRSDHGGWFNIIRRCLCHVGCWIDLDLCFSRFFKPTYREQI